MHSFSISLEKNSGQANKLKMAQKQNDTQEVGNFYVTNELIGHYLAPELDTQELQYSMNVSDSNSPHEIDSCKTASEPVAFYLLPELDTQELEYSINFTDSSSSDSEDSETESIPDIASLKPYDHEPVREIIDPVSSSDENDSEVEEVSRIGNTNWCQCGKCQPMQTYTESYCCQDTNEVPEDYFAGKIIRDKEI